MCKYSSRRVRRTSLKQLIRHVVNSRPMKEGPEWYADLNPRQQPARMNLHDLTFFFTLIKWLKREAEDPKKDITVAMQNVRERLQRMEFFTTLSPITIKKSDLLSNEGLPKIIENRVQGVDFPIDIRSDADLLFRKWMSGQIDPHLLRGIVTKKGTGNKEKTFKSHSMDPTFPGKVSCNYAGSGNLVVGQWWPLQICAKRDGAHGEIEAGIHGQVCHSHIKHATLTETLDRKIMELTLSLSVVAATPTLTTAIPLSIAAHRALRTHPQRQQT